MIAAAIIYHDHLELEEQKEVKDWFMSASLEM